jgi:cysteine desulfurase/selenocysteine lyase
MDVQAIRNEYKVLTREVNGKPLVYFDNAATTQKPRCVIDALSHYYEHYNANIHRGIHTLANEATAAYEQTRDRVARFIGGVDRKTIVFTRNTSESLNLVARTWGDANLGEGDEILITEMEHHSNLVPWFQLAERTGAVVRHIPVNPEDGTLRMEALDSVLTDRTRLVSFTACSNVLGTINPVTEIIARAHEKGAVTLVDAAQAAPHMPMNVLEWDADFVAFSAHKMAGPTGVGVLYGKYDLLDAMPPFLGGGEMIRVVELDHATYAAPPMKFEAGTPNIGDVCAFGATIDYLERIGMDNIRKHEIELTGYALEQMRSLDYLTFFGPEDLSVRGGVISFADPEIHPHDLSTILDQYGVAVRAGHHCAQPLMGILGVPATTRASFYIYNTPGEVDIFVGALKETRAVFGIA